MPSDVTTDATVDSIGPLSLEDAIAMSLQRNPDLAAVRAGEPAAAAAYRVAQTYPWNPQFQTQVLPYNRDRDGNDGAVAQQHVLLQTFELGGQRAFRIGAAAASWDQISDTIVHAELMNAAQTTRLYFTALYQRELRDLHQSLADLNEQLLGVLQRQEQAGQANRADVELARLESRSARRQQRLAEANYQTAVMNLRNQLNLDASSPMELDGQWLDWQWRALDDVIGGTSDAKSTATAPDSLPTAPDRDRAASMAVDDDRALRALVAGRPDVMAAAAAVAAATENVRLANAMRRPDLQVGPMWARDEASTEFWGVQAQIDIPVINNGKPLVEQRVAELHQQQVSATQLEDKAVLEARAAIRRYERARGLVEQSRGELTGSTADAIRPFENQFNAGQITLVELFAARAAVEQSRQSLLDLLNELAQAAADVTQAIGLPPQFLIAEVRRRPGPLEEVPLP